MSGAALAQDQLGNKGEEQSAEIQALALASDLLEYGQRTGDATALVLAAQILIDNPVGDVTEDRATVEDGESDASRGAVEEKDSNTLPFDVAEVLNEARSYARGNDALMETIATLEEQIENRARGYHYGYINGNYTIPAYGTREFNWTFTGGELAEILFTGDGDTDLDFYVYDSRGNLIASDTDYTDVAGWSWVPRSTQQYTFIVENLGSVYNVCRIISN